MRNVRVKQIAASGVGLDPYAATRVILLPMLELTRALRFVKSIYMPGSCRIARRCSGGTMPVRNSMQCVLARIGIIRHGI